MSALREELSLEDLLSITEALRKLKPNEQILMCVGVEQAKAEDRNVVFHVVNSAGEQSIVMISAEVLLDTFAS